MPGPNAVYMGAPDLAVVGVMQGWVGSYDPNTGLATDEGLYTSHDLHAAWGDGAGKTYVVGGRFFAPYEGVALVRATKE